MVLPWFLAKCRQLPFFGVLQHCRQGAFIVVLEFCTITHARFNNKSTRRVCNNIIQHPTSRRCYVAQQPCAAHSVLDSFISLTTAHQASAPARTKLQRCCCSFCCWPTGLIVFIGLGEQWNRFSANVAQICLKLGIVIKHRPPRHAFALSHLSNLNAKEFGVPFVSGIQDLSSLFHYPRIWSTWSSWSSHPSCSHWWCRDVASTETEHKKRNHWPKTITIQQTVPQHDLIVTHNCINIRPGIYGRNAINVLPSNPWFGQCNTLFLFDCCCCCSCCWKGRSSWVRGWLLLCTLLLLLSLLYICK